MTAKSTASRKLNSGPANATTILSITEIFGSFARSTSAFPSMMSIGASCVSARPLIGLQYRIEIWMRNEGVLVHYFFDNLPDTRKTHLSIQKRRDRNLIRGVHHRRQGSGGLACAPCQRQRWKIGISRRKKFQL